MKKILAIIALLLGMASLQAQETTFWGKVNHFLTKPAVVDTANILQRPASFSLGLFTTGQKAGFDVDVNFGIDMYDFGWFSGVSEYSLSENICTKTALRPVTAMSVSAMASKWVQKVLGKRANSHSTSLESLGVYTLTTSESAISSNRA